MLTIIIPHAQWSWRGIHWFYHVCPSVCPSVCPPVDTSVHLWTESCPLCIFYNARRIHFIFTHLIKHLQKVCCMKFVMPPPLGAGGIMFSGCPSVWSPSVRPSVRSLKHPLLTCTWVRWSTWPTVTVLWHVRPSVSLSVHPSGEVSGHLPENAWREWPEILYADVSWPSSELISFMATVCWFLYARLKNGAYYAVAMSVRPSVRLSVRPSVHPSVRVFRTFLQHALRYQFETWYIHLVGGTTCRVWVASQLGHFDLVYSQK